MTDDALPQHVAIIMDGNGRWAEQRGLPRIEGHKEGAQSVRDVVREARKCGIQALTLYAFSSQNWARPGTEVRGLMELLREYLIGERSEILDNEIRLMAIGNLARLPQMVREPLDELREASAHNTKMILTLALSYGGRESIAQAARAVAEKVARGELPAEAINCDTFGEHMATAHLPELDLLVRTSGELRISNFLLWESAYTELYFAPELWPEFRKEQLHRALQAFAGRQRRYGQTGAQIAHSAGESDHLEPGRKRN